MTIIMQPVYGIIDASPKYPTMSSTTSEIPFSNTIDNSVLTTAQSPSITSNTLPQNDLFSSFFSDDDVETTDDKLNKKPIDSKIIIIAGLGVLTLFLLLK